MNLDRNLTRSPLFLLAQSLNRPKLRVLAYHEVDTPESFAAQLDYVKREAHPVSLSDLLHSIRSAQPLPERATLITFDDGDLTVLNTALPLLRERGLPAVAFVVADRTVNQAAPFWWEEATQLFDAGGSVSGLAAQSVEELLSGLKRLSCTDLLVALQELRQTAHSISVTTRPRLQPAHLPVLESNGIDVGSHSHTHPILSRCSDDEIEEEVTRAHDFISEWLGHEPLAFAYPNGNWDERVTGLLSDLGYQAAFLFDHRLEDPLPRAPLGISRLRVSASASVDRFALIHSGLHSWLLRMRRRA